MRLYPSTALVSRTLIMFGLPAITSAEEWVLGGSGGTQWPVAAERLVHIDYESMPGAIQAERVLSGQNITASLEWLPGSPDDFQAVDGQARIWTNSTRYNRQPGPTSPLGLVDLNPETSTGAVFETGNQAGIGVYLDFGVGFPVDRIRFYPAPGRENLFMRAFDVLVSDGWNFDASGRPVYEEVVREVDNQNPVVDLAFPLRSVRITSIRHLGSNSFDMAEIEAYGEGFVGEAIYETGPIHAEAVPQNPAISWATQVLEMRDGELVAVGTAEAYTSFSVRVKVGSDDTPVEDPQNWSSWSPPLSPGERLPVAEGTPYFVLRIVLQSRSPRQTVRLDSLVIGEWQPSPGDDECAQKEGDLHLINSSSLALIGEPGACFEVGGNVYITGSELTDVEPLRGLRRVGGDLMVDNPALHTLAGLRGLEEVAGVVSIAGTRSLTSLDGLESLTAVGGGLEIRHNTSLASIAGLGGLSHVGGSGIAITSNDALTGLAPLAHLTRIEGSLRVVSNDILAQLDGLSAVTEVTGSISVSGNRRLESLAGLGSITRVGGELELSANPLLKNVDSLRNLADLGGGLAVTGNDALDDLGGLSHLTRIEGALAIESGVLRDLSVFGGIERIGRTLAIRRSPHLRDLNGLRNLKFAGGITLEHNASLSDLSALRRIRELPEGLTISGCEALANLAGLDSLESVREVQIARNNVLVDLGGLQSLTIVSGDLDIWANPSLTSIMGLERVARVGRNVRLWSNGRLADLRGFEALSYVGGGFEISGNDSLRSLAGLERLVEIGSAEEYFGDAGLVITGNPVLHDVDGLRSLRRIGGRLAISDNPALRNLSGLAYLEAVGWRIFGGQLTIVDNESLPTRIAHVLAERLAQLGFGGEIQVSGNQPDPELAVSVASSTTELRFLTKLLVEAGVSLDLTLAPLVCTIPVVDLDSTQLGSANAIRRVVWVADTPPGTRIGVRSRTGAGMQTVYRYFLANGVEVTKERYEKVPRIQRGEIVAMEVLGEGWSDWSDWGWQSGSSFQSPTPRRYLQAQVSLASEDPRQFPVLHSVAFVTDTAATVVTEHSEALPGAITLVNYPNPFNSSTVISFSLPQTQTVVVEVYDMAGQRVALLLEARREAGLHVIFWDGRSRDGQLLASGIYLCQLRTSEAVRERKLVLVR